MAITISGALPRRFYNPGNAQTFEFALPDDVVEIHIGLDRGIGPDAWPDTGDRVVTFWFDYSYDGGKTWVKGERFGSHGGTHVHRLGLTVFFSPMTFRIAPGVNRRIRANIDVTARFRLEGTLVLSTQQEATIRLPGEERI